MNQPRLITVSKERVSEQTIAVARAAASHTYDGVEYGGDDGEEGESDQIAETRRDRRRHVVRVDVTLTRKHHDRRHQHT